MLSEMDKMRTECEKSSVLVDMDSSIATANRSWGNGQLLQKLIGVKNKPNALNLENHSNFELPRPLKAKLHQKNTNPAPPRYCLSYAFSGGILFGLALLALGVHSWYWGTYLIFSQMNYIKAKRKCKALLLVLFHSEQFQPLHFQPKQFGPIAISAPEKIN